MTVPQIHVRNMPSDSDPAIVWEAVERKTSPAFIERPGFLQCPRCKRFWPEDHFKAGHDSVETWRPQARCLSCRRGVNHALREQAIRTGICEARSCSAPIVERHKCAFHLSLAVSAYVRRGNAAAPRPAAPAPAPSPGPVAPAPRPAFCGAVPTPRLVAALAAAK